MVYVKTELELCSAADGYCTYEVGAMVARNGEMASEPELSAPGCKLDDSRLAVDPQSREGGFESGWTIKVQRALEAAYEYGVGEGEYDFSSKEDY